MRVKSYKGKVFGAELTAAERKAMNIEINRQIAERDALYAADFDAMVLYTLMAHYGWKRKRLRRFWNAFVAEHKALREHYQTGEDIAYMANEILKNIGVDIHQWYKEDTE